LVSVPRIESDLRRHGWDRMPSFRAQPETGRESRRGGIYSAARLELTALDVGREAVRGERRLMRDGVDNSAVELAHLIPREEQILALLVEGQPTKAIAAGIGISERCVKWHLSNLYRKLAVDCRVSAVAYALRRSAPSLKPPRIALEREPTARLRNH
jgi:DNA-binding NarL/FixJ family response regulator